MAIEGGDRPQRRFQEPNADGSKDDMLAKPLAEGGT
jgi:hypothetical protein